MANISKAFLLKKYKRNSSGLELFNYIMLIILLVLSIVLISSLNQLRIYAEEVPTEDKIRAELGNRGENSNIYDRNGELLYTFKDPNRDREYAEFEEIPPTVVVAALAAEDKDFFIHEGIDYLGAARGLITTISTNGEVTVGGSTITQQLIKQTLLTDERTVDRKAKEAIISLQVEQTYTKEEILEYYLNVSPFGGRVQGIKTAASTYFDKDLQDLTLNESIFLMSLVQSPGEYSPLFANDVELAKSLSNQRRLDIIEQVEQNPRLVAYLNSDGDSKILYNKDLTAIDETAGNEDPVFDEEKFSQMRAQEFEFQQPQEKLRAPHWVFYIRSILQQDPYNLSIEDLYSGGYNIYTSLDIRMQELAQQELKEGVDIYGPRYNFENAGTVGIDPRNGEVLVMVGSKGYDLPNDPNNKRFDPEVNVTTSRHQLGSTLKPFVAVMGIESGRFSQYSTVADKPKTFYGFYKPKNSDGKFRGNMTLHKALIDSRNLPFLRMSYDLGDWRLPELMKEIGYRDDATYGLAATVGGVDESLLSNTVAYTGLANGGTVMEPKPILRIEEPNGTLRFKSSTDEMYQFNENAVGQVNAILGDKYYTPGTLGYKFFGGQKLAGKTGTSERQVETYYMGYGPNLVVGVWAGNNDNSSMRYGSFGSNTALPIWNGITSSLIYEFPEYGEYGSY
jgi:membrane peptidoglycan carboxypeptidase